MSVNLSGKQFMQADLIDQVKTIIKDTGIASGSLWIEVTESILMKDTEFVTSILEQLRDLNVRVHVDDFGTGYSSLSSLHHFPVNTLKIDRSFVSKIESDNGNDQSAIIGTILSLAENLGLEVIAEGVETLGQAKKLISMNCKFAQGYYYSRPVPSDKVAELIGKPLGGEEVV